MHGGLGQVSATGMYRSMGTWNFGNLTRNFCWMKNALYFIIYEHSTADLLELVSLLSTNLSSFFRKAPAYGWANLDFTRISSMRSLSVI